MKEHTPEFEAELADLMRQARKLPVEDIIDPFDPDNLALHESLPPVTAYESDPKANGHTRAKFPVEHPCDDASPLEPINWAELHGEPPPRCWWIQDWLGPNPTLVSGPGGAGKTRLWQAVGTALATRRAYLAGPSPPLKVLMWLCEESREEVWRQQMAINRHFSLDMDDLRERFYVVPRQGHENTLLDLSYGRPMFTPLLETLREQVNDLAIDVLVLDNLAQLFGGSENDRHQATYFVNGIAGLVMHRPFCPVLVGHVARSAGSEYSGSAAWENAVRMRWYVGPTLPDQQQTEDEANDPDVVYLARRKANYAPKDWRKLKYTDGVLVPVETNASPGDYLFRQDAAEQVLLAALPKLCSAGLMPTDGKTSADYLPAQAIAKGYHQGHNKRELIDAMNRLMGTGRLKREIVGKYANRAPRYGLVIR